MIVDLEPKDRFAFHPTFQSYLKEQPYTFGFEGVGAAVYYRSYANPLPEGGTEHWPDTVLRMITGALTIFKWHQLRNNRPYDEHYWDAYAMRMAEAAFNMRWLPAGRSVQHNGKELIYEKGAAFLQNCAATTVVKLSRDVYWVADMALCGVGIGFATDTYTDTLKMPAPVEKPYVIPDTREGWADSISDLIKSYEDGSETLVFDYSKIRPAGSLIKSIGGVAPGPEPLKLAHSRLRTVLDQYARGEISPVRMVTDVVNIVGACVVSGGQRRTALIALGDPGDVEFANLKNYGKQNKQGEWIEQGPSFARREWGWASNNSVVLKHEDDFAKLPEVADAIRINGEPGVLNMINIQKYGRLTEEKHDDATLINPCGEQPLEDKEVCCLSEVYYMNNHTESQLYEAIEFATTFASMVTLLPTHNDLTNEKIFKNRRIGVSMSGVAEAIQKEPRTSMIRKLRNGYRIAQYINREHANRCGVPASVRVTTVKPSGSTSLVAGSSPGLHFPMYGRYIRRMRVQNQAPILERLMDAGLPWEPDDYDPNSTVFEFPVNLGPIRGQKQASMYEKGDLAVDMQRHWSDNATSVTVTFDKKREGDDVEAFLADKMPYLKSISMLPELDADDDEITFTQHPYEEITLKEYERRKAQIRPIDWRNFQQSGVELELFCDSDSCAI